MKRDRFYQGVIFGSGGWVARPAFILINLGP